MKKIFTLVAAAVMALAVNAKDYEGTFNLTISGAEQDPIQSSVTVDPVEASSDTPSYNIVLNKFKVKGLTFEKITLSNVAADETTGSGYTFFKEGTYTAQITKSPISFIKSLDITIEDGSCVDEAYSDLYLKINMNVDLVVSQIPVTGVFGNDPFAITKYTDKMNVKQDDDLVAEGIEATIEMQRNKDDGRYTLSLKNFMLGTAGIGNITINGGVVADDGNGIKRITAWGQPITITPGDIEDVNWDLGENLNGLNLFADLNGEIENGKLNATID
ncbi:MAG TPA: calycin-like domain-containing protein, partial [Candidatus Prevotella stercoripullorum]|nr:calycin-like domain-containing protein [Candidatus Prevotella stercoripullorum]